MIEAKLAAIAPPTSEMQLPQPGSVARPEYAPGERVELLQRIRRLLKQRDAVLVAHYYTDEDLQWVADETGGYVSDSLDMARFGNEHSASTLVVAGVRFMGETARFSTRKNVYSCLRWRRNAPWILPARPSSSYPSVISILSAP